MKVVHSSHELLEKIDIVKVITSYVSLGNKDSKFRGHCPFHNANDNSFMVSPKHQVFKCFKCQEGGNAIKFVMTIENLGYYDACKRLAEMFELEYITRCSHGGDDVSGVG